MESLTVLLQIFIFVFGIGFLAFIGTRGLNLLDGLYDRVHEYFKYSQTEREMLKLFRGARVINDNGHLVNPDRPDLVFYLVQDIGSAIVIRSTPPDFALEPLMVLRGRNFNPYHIAKEILLAKINADIDARNRELAEKEFNETNEKISSKIIKNIKAL